jgi:hypothetical protein
MGNRHTVQRSKSLKSYRNSWLGHTVRVEEKTVEKNIITGLRFQAETQFFVFHADMYTGSAQPPVLWVPGDYEGT